MSEAVITEPPPGDGPYIQAAGRLDRDEPQRREVAVVPPSDPMSILALAVANGRDPAVLEKIMDLQERYERNIAEGKYNAAMANCQRAMPTTIKASQENKHTQSMYADLADVAKVMKPIYTLYGFSLSFGEDQLNKRPEDVGVYCDVRHSGGFTVRHRGDFPLDTAGFKGGANKTAIQGKGSTLTYGRRYLTLMAFDIAVGDDDGNAPLVFVTAEQILELNDLIRDCQEAGNPVNVPAFLKWLEAKDLNDILASDFEKAVRELKRKAASKNGGGKCAL